MSRKSVVILITGFFIMVYGFVSLAFAETEAGPTEVCGTISTDTTWTAAESPYVVTCNIIVGTGGTLTLEAGTQVKVNEGFAITATNSGTVFAQGTSAAPVMITSIKDDSVGGDTNNDENATSPAPGDWEHFKVSRRSSAALEYTILRYGGGGAAALYIFDDDTNESYSPQVMLTHSRIEQSGSNGVVIQAVEDYGVAHLTMDDSKVLNSVEHGIYMESNQRFATTQLTIRNGSEVTGSGSHGVYSKFYMGAPAYKGKYEIDIEDSSIHNNVGYGIFLNEADVSLHDNNFENNSLAAMRLVWDRRGYSSGISGNSGDGNGLNGIELAANILVDTTLIPNANFPYIFDDLGTRKTLIVEAGTIIKPKNSFLVDGSGVFRSKGTSINPVIITSIKDDEVGGDTNNNGNATSPAHGDWDRFEVRDWGSIDLEHTSLRYGGGNGGALYIYDDDTEVESNPQANLTQSSIEYSGSNGIVVHAMEDNSLAQLMMDGSKVLNSDEHGIYMESNQNNALTRITVTNGSEVVENGIDGIYSEFYMGAPPYKGKYEIHAENSSIYDNVGYGIFVGNPQRTAAVAEYNWWGSNHGPDPFGPGNGINYSGSCPDGLDCVFHVDAYPFASEEYIQNGCDDATATQPLLLVPGWGAATVLSWDEMGFANLRQPLEKKGYREGCNLFYAGETSGDLSLNENAEIIRDSLCAAWHKVRDDKQPWNGSFDIIAHSYGGLRSRAYLENDTLYGPGVLCADPHSEAQDYGLKVRNLFTLGSPHGGGDTFLPGAFALAGIHLWQHQWTSSAQLTIPHMLYYNETHTQPPSVTYHLIGGNAFLQILPPEVYALYFSYMPLSGGSALIPNDLGVYQWSATELSRFPWTNRYPNVIAHMTPDLHGALKYNSKLFDYNRLANHRSFVSPDPWDTFYDEIVPWLFNPSQPAPQQMDRAQTTATAEETPAVPFILLASDFIAHGETHTGTFEVAEGGQSTFYLKWPQGDLDFSLTDAGGNTIDPLVAESDPNVDYFEMEVLSLTATYVFTDTASGTWSYSITGADLAAEVPYQLIRLPERPIAVTVEADPWQIPGATIGITATVTYEQSTPLADALVTATISRPDGTTDLLDLHDDGLHNDGPAGDGVYGNDYTGTNLGGMYSAVVEANGIYESQAYQRTAETYFSISSGAALLTGVYSDQPRDDGGDGRHEGLELLAGIDVSVAGNYTISGDLHTAAGDYISHAMLQAQLSPGVQDVTLIFLGSDILLSGVDGPYTLSNMMILDSDNGGLLLDEAADVHTTAAYNHQEFDTYPTDCLSGTGENATVTLPEDITFSGYFQPLPGDQFAIFNPAGTLCAGKGIWTGAALQITIWGDDPGTPEIDGLVSGEPLRYHLWETATAKERQDLAATYRQGDGLFAVGGSQVLDRLALADQEIPMAAGWNMISSSVIPGDVTLEAVFDGIAGEVVLVKNGSGEVYWPGYSVDQILNWDMRDGYQVYLNSAVALNILGTATVAEEVLFDLPQGWSLISYLPDTPQLVAEAMSSLGDRLYLVKNGAGEVYWPEHDINMIGDMQPGEGYQVYLTGQETLVFPSGN